MYKWIVFNSTKNVIDTITVELDELKVMISKCYGREIGQNCSKLGFNCQILINSAKVIFGMEIRSFLKCTFLFNRIYQYANIYSLVSLLMPYDQYLVSWAILNSRNLDSTIISY